MHVAERVSGSATSGLPTLIHSSTLGGRDGVKEEKLARHYNVCSSGIYSNTISTYKSFIHCEYRKGARSQIT